MLLIPKVILYGKVIIVKHLKIVFQGNIVHNGIADSVPRFRVVHSREAPAEMDMFLIRLEKFPKAHLIRNPFLFKPIFSLHGKASNPHY